mgnify:FL=1
MAVRRMDIFGDDSTEDVETGDIFYHSSAERSNGFSAEHNEPDDRHSDFTKQSERNTPTSSTKNVERVYDYGGRHKFTGELYEEVPDEYEDSHRKEFEQSRSRMRDRDRERNYSNEHHHEWKRKPQYHYEHGPHHSGNVQKSNVSPIIKLLGLVLLIMGVIFVIKGHPEYSAVVVLVIIMYVLNFFTINKKGSGSRRQR